MKRLTVNVDGTLDMTLRLQVRIINFGGKYTSSFVMNSYDILAIVVVLQ